ncbi:MAG: hypothetical protein H6698_08435 [Myxococcales bacterium]|nr:hypothetical protein [Myxococcales bacterium]MCB9520139.1 hypothetical protein [Myxococcales bacterium]MCB9531240.1 hypothetical protein [Myxococcales bacterium]MCB9534317.1 hypothetical protein [Myxococcales bacterium]
MRVVRCVAYMQERAMVTWEKVLETEVGGVYRARVDGGWLVSQRYGSDPEQIEFVADDDAMGPQE